MLTKSQITKIANRYHINPYYQEKDYIQNLFLFNLYQTNSSFIFKGETCLKICYGYRRYSEDLDFNSSFNPKKISKYIDISLKKLKLVGIEHEFHKKELFEESYTSKIHFWGPLFSGKRESTNSLQIDVGYRGGTILEPKVVNIYSKYPDIDMYSVKAMEEEEILAEKIRALSQRSLPRDLYDIWCMIEKGIKIRKKLIFSKLGVEKIPNFFYPTEREFNDNLRDFISLPSYKIILEKVDYNLKEL